jgi:hypothetical protein
MTKLKLGYKKLQDYYAVWIVHQDEDLRMSQTPQHGDDAPPLFELGSWQIKSVNLPEIRAEGYSHKTLFIRGTTRDLDDIRLSASKRTLEALCVLVARFNGRKNVVRLSDTGVVL